MERRVCGKRWSAEAVNRARRLREPRAIALPGRHSAARPWRWVEVAVLSLILFLALSGNACVLLALRTTRHKHSRLFFAS